MDGFTYRGEELIFHSKSSFMFILPSTEFTQTIEKCWTFCSQENLNEDVYKCYAESSTIPMTSLCSVVMDGSYLIRFSVREIDRDNKRIDITDGTAECTVFFDDTILDFFKGQTMEEVVDNCS